MGSFNITPVSNRLHDALESKINRKTKPVRSLGRLEEIALRVGLIRDDLSPSLVKPHILVFAGDHGIAHEGVSAYPQEVTWQMVMNFMEGGAAINVLCRQHDITLKVVDAGVNYLFPQALNDLIHNKAGMGTANFSKGQAMSVELAQACIDTAADIVKTIAASGCNVVGFGDMGIANSSSAALLMSVLCDLPIEKCVGRGTGLNDAGLNHKVGVLRRSLDQNGWPDTPLKALATYGGFEIAQMTGAILQAAANRMVILIDGFIATVSYLAALAVEPLIKNYCIFCHQSREHGHKLLLEYLEASPLLSLEMGLGEGTGVAVAYPLIESAVSFLNEMASFESSGVSSGK